MIFATALVYVSYLIGFLFSVLCLACGLYYLAELVEEYTTRTRKVLRYTIITVLVLHVLGWLFEDLPKSCLLPGIIAHGCYYSLLAKFPYIELTAPRFLASVVMLIINHTVWFRFFSVTWFPFSEIVAYFLLFVWAVPFIVFVSLSANEGALPFQGGAMSSSLDGDDGRGKRSSLIKSLLQRIHTVKTYILGDKSL